MFTLECSFPFTNADSGGTVPFFVYSIQEPAVDFLNNV